MAYQSKLQSVNQKVLFKLLLIYLTLLVVIVFIFLYLEDQTLHNHLHSTAVNETNLFNELHINHKSSESSHQQVFNITYSSLKLLPLPLFGFSDNQYLADDWQVVSGSKYLFYVYSAFYDDRLDNAVVRVIAVARTKNYETVKGKFWYYNKIMPKFIYCTLNPIHENWNLLYSAFFILCPLENYSLPDAISIFITDSAKISNYLVINNKPNSRRHLVKDSIALCVKPMHYDYNRVFNLIEFIEFNQILGVSHFILYNHTIGKDVDCLLKKYIQNGLVTVLPWTLKGIVSQKDIRTEALFAALNDCLYRTMYKFNYLAMIDFDEYIIPHVHPNLTLMIKSLIRNESAGFSFRNSFFYLQWPDDPKYILDKPQIPLTTLAKTRRTIYYHVYGVRSKMIVLPQNIFEVGNHGVWKSINKKWLTFVKPSIAFLHHYRICEFGGDDCVKSASIIDQKTYFWKDELIRAVNTTFQAFNLTCKFSAIK